MNINENRVVFANNYENLLAYIKKFLHHLQESKMGDDFTY